MTSSLLDHLDHLDHLDAESARFLAVLSTADPAARVPTCPDWDAADLVWHLAEVQLFWAAVVRGPVLEESGIEAVEASKPPRPASWSDLLDLARSAHAGLAGALRDGTDDDPVWTWSTDRTRGFVRRRQVHEALVHRVDAELTAGVVGAVDPVLAADGVDELLRVFWSGAPDWAAVTPVGGTVEVRATDVDRTWVLQPGRLVGTSPGTGTTYDEATADVVDDADPAAAVAVLAGPAAALDLWLWGRSPGGQDVVQAGDDAALAAVRAVVADGVQ